ncbi:hypothetical protein DUI87_12979 [Hirundo rustica rustica]|uniref:Uncharacterized protein n=1 Tax=Hirundo rustica rustica TaxID=333673 RepID=A0A3M0KAG6_HIRRU|nr:hypothetical protein DUI87_12979 [Hirundo rustica rustica]
MRPLENLNIFSSRPIGIQMCHPFWCKEYHDDFWGQQEQNFAEGETTGWIGPYKRAFAEKSLHIWQGKLDKASPASLMGLAFGNKVSVLELGETFPDMEAASGVFPQKPTLKLSFNSSKSCHVNPT